MRDRRDAASFMSAVVGSDTGSRSARVQAPSELGATGEREWQEPPCNNRPLQAALPRPTVWRTSNPSGRTPGLLSLTL